MSLTKGELLELIKDLPDDTKVISASTNFEMGGQLVDGRAHVDNYTSKKEVFRDAFSNDRYTRIIYEYGENDGERVIVISGS